ncbi:DEAD-domain-containing protein [Poronia punctata]|nr:DEAD-domain-containing protein [Poronia punctata]
MFKASIQRQVRLGSLTRQLSSISLRRSTRFEQIAGLRQTTLQSPVVLRPSPCIQAFRLFSAESDAARENRQDEFAEVASAPVSKFSQLSQLGVNDGLVRALTQGMGYENMTEVQAMTINSALKGVDMVAQAKTGTGKTLAFLVPVFQRVLIAQPELINPGARRNASSQNIRAIILSPTRELALQIAAEAQKLARNTGIVVQTAVGGTQKRESLQRMWREGCDVLVGTPGRLNDLLSDPTSRVSAPNLEALVLDEADRMLDVGFADELRSIMDFLPSTRDVERQTLLFSATIPQSVISLAKTMVRPHNFEFVQTIKEDDVPTHQRVPQHLVKLAGYENIYPTIMEIANQAKVEHPDQPFKAVVFCSTTAGAQYAHQVFRGTSLAKSGVRLHELHSKLTQNRRTTMAESFRRAESAILFASDVAARGMDFPNVTDVIQIGLPTDRDIYIHRIGRTGRAGNSGKGWILLAEEEIAEARTRLPGLPIKVKTDLEAASYRVGASSGEAPSAFSEIEEAYGRAPKSLFASVYLSQLGQKMSGRIRADDIIRLLNNWVSKGLRWDEPPAVPHRVAQNRNIAHIPGVRLGNNNYDDGEEFEQSFGSNSRGGFSRGGSRDGGFSRGGSRDGGFSRGGSRDGGFSRGGSRDSGFSRGGSRDGGFSRGGSRDGGFSRGGSRDGGFSRGGSRGGQSGSYGSSF